MHRSMTSSFKIEREAVGHVQLFSTQKISITEDEYLQGYEAAQNEVAEKNNPFELHSRAYGNWSDGWWDGFYNEAPRFVSLSETIIPFPIRMQKVEEPLPKNEVLAFAAKTKKTWKQSVAKISFFKQPWADIFFEVFATVFLVGVTYELIS